MTMTKQAPTPVSRPLLDLDRFQRVIDHGSVADLQDLRLHLLEKKNSAQSQLDCDNAEWLEDRQEMIEQGFEPEEAGLRARANGDPDWRARCSAFVRLCETWLGKVRVRIGILQPNQPLAWRATPVIGAAWSAPAAAEAINAMIDRGHKVASAFVIGADLVVIAAEPKS